MRPNNATPDGIGLYGDGVGHFITSMRLLNGTEVNVVSARDDLDAITCAHLSNVHIRMCFPEQSRAVACLSAGSVAPQS